MLTPCQKKEYNHFQVFASCKFLAPLGNQRRCGLSNQPPKRGTQNQRPLRRRPCLDASAKSQFLNWLIKVTGCSPPYCRGGLSAVARQIDHRAGRLSYLSVNQIQQLPTAPAREARQCQSDSLFWLSVNRPCACNGEGHLFARSSYAGMSCKDLSGAAFGRTQMVTDRSQMKSCLPPV